MKSYRQGDLLIVEAGPVEGLRPRDGLVLQHGEATGHSHRMTAGTLLENPAGDLFVQLAGPADVVHEEHGTIHLPAGFFQVLRQREYTDWAPRYVED